MGKVRGRRSEKKEKEGNNEFEYGTKNENENGDAIIEETKVENNSTAFFGLVDSTELTYFHQAEQTLNLDTFQSDEEKDQFVSSVFQEAKGKELKLVTNQICSKLMERLILQSKLKNIHQLFNTFNGRFFELSKQKYSSHVLETFLVRCASLIEKEILSNGHIPEEDAEEEDENEDEGQGYVSMENMLLFIIGEFKPHLKQMIKDKYASHVLRISLLVLTGKELPSSTESNSILRSKKSKIARKMIEIKDSKDYEKQFQVPISFKEELKEILKVIIDNESCESLRELSIEAVASPVIQLLIQLEGIVDRDRTIYNLIFNGGENKESKINEKERAFVEYLLSNNIGSHFLQKSIENQKAKSIERLYNNYMKDRVVKLAKRETTGVYVIESLMEKLKKKDQIDILNDLVPVLNELIVNNLEIGGKIVDCSIRNNNYLKDEIVKKFMDFFNKKPDSDSNNNNNTNNILENVLKLSTSTLHSTKDDWPTSEERRRSLFLEKLIIYDDKILHECIENILDLDDTTLIKLCKHGVFSHIIECCIEQTNELTMIEKKRLLNILVPHIVELSCNATGSHIVDKLWGLTFKLNMYKERIAKELFDNKDTVKITIYGKMVWKNWGMEMYCRKFNDWKRIIKNEEYEKKDKEEEEKRKVAEEEEEEENKKRTLDDDDKTNKRRRGRK